MSKQQRNEFYSGLPWETVTRAQAHAHPKGRLGVVEWLIVAYFIGAGLLKFYLVLDAGAGMQVAILNSIWPILTGLGLAFRVPWAVIMAMISCALTVYALVRGLGGYNSEFDAVIVLLETLASVGILFYLLEADRPNLIYRHRYRLYSAEAGGEDAKGAETSAETSNHTKDQA